MDEWLRHTKENMNNTVMKEIHFNEENKNYVLQAISKKRNKKRFLKPSLRYALSIGTACMFFLGMGYYVSEKLDLSPGKENSIIVEPQEPQIGSDAVHPPLIEESYEDMTKKEVLEKLLNTVDYFETASGELELFTTYGDGSTSVTTTEFKLSNKRNFGGYDKTTEKLQNGGESVNETIYNDKKIWRKESVGKTYTACAYQPVTSQETFTTPDEAFSVEESRLFKPNTKLRERPLPYSRSGLSLFPYEMTVRNLRDEHLWKIEKQNEEVAGHNTIVLFGEFDEQNKELMKNETFRFWVDKDTGILVKYEMYDSEGAARDYLHPIRLDLNVPVDPEEIEPNLDGYNRMDLCVKES
ncbi:hypothetical protein ACQ0QQ_13875 [Lysinibacillus sphaericus]